MSIQVVIFEGGETIPSELNKLTTTDNITIDCWNKESIRKAFIKHLGEDWANGIMDDGEGNDKPIDTIDVINDTIAQCTTDNIDYGMTYMVRLNSQSKISRYLHNVFRYFI